MGPTGSDTVNGAGIPRICHRELRNLVEALEEEVSSNMLSDAELFIFMDNTTAEGAYYRGNSDSKPLFELILRL